MDPIEAFDEIMRYVLATQGTLTPAPLYLALLRATDEMVAHSGGRHPDDQIMTQRPEEVALLRERMAELGM